MRSHRGRSGDWGGLSHLRAIRRDAIIPSSLASIVLAHIRDPMVTHVNLSICCVIFIELLAQDVKRRYGK